MAKETKVKKISISDFERIKTDVAPKPVEVEWNGVTITVRRTVSLKEMMQIVHDVVQSCFTSDTGEYIPEIKEFALKSSVLETYANFKLPANIERKYDLIYNTDAYYVVAQHIDERQYMEIIKAIDEKINHIAQANVESVTAQLNNIYGEFANLENQFGELFEGVNAADLSKFLNRVATAPLVDEYVKDARESSETEAGNDKQ